MTLGERIAALRSARGMSQGELAEKLNVSRQSISKWETGASIPELDNLIQLSGLFHVTLDELVKGEPAQTAAPCPAPPPAAQPAAAPQGSHTKKVVGTILLCFGVLILLLLTLLGGFLGGLLFGAPFLLCGAVCLLSKQNTGLWCCWALFFAVNFYLRFATGITWRLTLMTLIYEPSWNYLRLAFAWLELFCFVGMVAATVLRFQKQELVLTARGKALYLAGWVAFGLLYLPVSYDPLSWVIRGTFYLKDWLKVGLFTALLSATLRLVRTRRAAKNADAKNTDA